MNERESFVVASIAGESRLFELGAVREIVPAMTLARPLSVRGHCRGVANVRGHVVPVFDLGGRSGALDPSQYIIIAVHDDGTEIGVLVDDVLEIVELERGEVVSHPVGLGRTGRTVNLRGQTVGVLTPAEVVHAA